MILPRIDSNYQRLCWQPLCPDSHSLSPPSGYRCEGNALILGKQRRHWRGPMPLAGWDGVGRMSRLHWERMTQIMVPNNTNMLESWLPACGQKPTKRKRIAVCSNERKKRYLALWLVTNFWSEMELFTNGGLRIYYWGYFSGANTWSGF